MENKNRMLDRRVYKRYLDKGLLKANELEQHLKALPDDAANAVFVQVEDDSDLTTDNVDSSEEPIQ